MSKRPRLVAPYPYFGGKARVAHIVWRRFGNVPNYVEPFFGSGAVLLGRPTKSKIETVNDKCCFVSNFWRALQHDPAAVAEYADWPVNEADLHARHLWLVNQQDFIERMKSDPDFYDAKIAGWWVWGISCWIGAGWCESAYTDKKRTKKQIPSAMKQGVHAKRPSLGSGQGKGVNKKRPPLGRPFGVNRQRPHLGDAGQGSVKSTGDLYGYLERLASRLRRVRVCCGDWKRVVTETPTIHAGTPCAVFLDPPYSAEANRESNLYSVDDLSVAHEVREWCIENGNNKDLRIALCGYEGEHTMPSNWSSVNWKTQGGMANTSNEKDTQAKKNAKREVIWFSPGCIKVVKRASFF